MCVFAQQEKLPADDLPQNFKAPVQQTDFDKRVVIEKNEKLAGGLARAEVTATSEPKVRLKNEKPCTRLRLLNGGDNGGSRAIEHDDCLVGDLGQPTPRDRAQAGMQQINRSRRDDNRNTRRR